MNVRIFFSTWLIFLFVTQSFSAKPRVEQFQQFPLNSRFLAVLQRADRLCSDQFMALAMDEELERGDVFLIEPARGYQIELLEQFKQVGYVEICNNKHGAATYDSLYAHFDALIEFLQTNPVWAKKLYIAKERFIRSKERSYYSTDFFGFYDESEREGRSQISFYYSTHFHEFICSHYPEFIQVLEIISFFEACFEIQKTYRSLFNQVATELSLETIFSSKYGHPPILFKVIKYLPSYKATRPHYDGTAFSLFLDSTDNRSLLFSPYKPSLTVDDFSSPPRECSRGLNQNSILLIPGLLLAEFSIYPTPHIVVESGKIRYSTIAFAMRPNYTAKKNELPPLPSFNLKTEVASAP